ncbi:MAG: glucosyltransferase domain-containing protein [Lachnospiraceae bacterium]|nr:glucosyltransferase domain-containing protein [Lachnospiraceae bacterium]
MPLTNRQKNILTASATSLFFFLMHGYRFFHPLLAGDSLYMLYQDDIAWQISLGRFAQPLFLLLRGSFPSPFLTSLLSVSAVAASAVLCTRFLSLEDPVSLVMTGAVMSCNLTLLVAGSGFLPWFDLYAFALLSAVAGTLLLTHKKKSHLVCGVLLLVLSLGLYQAYICVATGLVMLTFLADAAKGEDIRALLKKLFRTVLLFFCAALLYVLVWRFLQGALRIATAESYHGLSSLGDFSETSVAEALFVTYRNVFRYFFAQTPFLTPDVSGLSLGILWSVLLAACCALMLLLSVMYLAQLNRAQKTAPLSRILQLVTILLFPLGINLVCFLSRGMEHALMMYACQLVFLAAVCIRELALPGRDDTTAPSGTSLIQKTRRLLPLLLAVITWSQIVFGNQIYYRRDQTERASFALMNRIVDRIEETPGYEPGTTPVAFCGSFAKNPHTARPAVFSEADDILPGHTAFSYPGTEATYLSFFESMDLTVIRFDEDNGAVRAMPLFPAEGSVALIDGVIVVKVSD